MKEHTPSQAGASGRWKRILARFGLAGFLFFFIKGLVWIAVFTLGWKGCEALRNPQGASMSAHNPQVASHEFLPFEGFDDPLLLGFVLEIDKRESLRATALAVANYGDMLDRSCSLNQFPELLIPGLVGKVPYVNRHSIAS